MNSEDSIDQLAISLESIKLPNNFPDIAPVKRRQVQFNVGRPHKQEWFMISDKDQHRGRFALLEMADDQKKYLVSTAAINEIPNEIYFAEMHLGITKRGDYFLFDLKILPDGKTNSWISSKAVAIQTAKEEWIRLASNQGVGAYDVYTSPQDKSRPEWPAEDLLHFLKQAFSDRFINSADHPIIRHLKGLP